MTTSGAGKTRALIPALVVDDHPILCAGKRQVMDAAADVAVLADEAGCAGALNLAAEHHPDVLVPNPNLFRLSGVDVTPQLQEQRASTATLVLTVHHDSQTVLGPSKAGQPGTCSKT